MHLITYFVVATLIGVLAFWLIRFSGYAPEPYRSRPCQGRAWKTTFPEKSKHEIRVFLLIFSNAFTFRQCQKLQINPCDGILELYQAIYPTNHFGIDNLELEAFARDLEKKYKMDLGAMWSESLTFGRLYQYCNHSQAQFVKHSMN
jgi:propanediol dehydratase small subunit